MKKRLIKVRLTGTSPLLLHSDRYANPLDPLTKKHKALTGKRKKTDEDQEAILKSEWLGSLYFDKDGTIHVPGLCIEATLFNGAKLQKLGQTFKRGVAVVEDKAKLKYTGPKEIEALWEKEEFRDVRGVRVGQAKIMRCRPKFFPWSIDCSIAFHGEVVSEHDVIKAFEDAGEFIGLCDYRPRFGRFEVEVLK